MKAKDVMTTGVLSVSPTAKVSEIAEILYEHHISAVPVIDAGGKLMGIVSEGDLLHRGELGTERKRSWWLTLFTDSEQRANDYVKSHAQMAKDIMTKEVISVKEEAPLSDIAHLLEKHRIKRVMVIKEGKVTGIVSRANVIQGLAVRGQEPSALTSDVDDRSIREQLNKVLHDELGMSTVTINIIVENGVVSLWGLVEGAKQRKAIEVAASNVPGAKKVENHLALFSSIPGAGV